MGCFVSIALALLAIIGQLTIVLPITKADDRSALLDFMSLADPTNSFPIQNTSDYCQWNGIGCDELRRVVSIERNKIGLNGTLLQDLFSRLDKLQILSLSQNKLRGTIPPLSQATSLSNLLLDGNELSGPIPNSLAQLTNLEVVNLRNNYLSGNLPDSPNFISLTFFDVSHNNLSGPIPSSLSRFGKSSFEGNSLLCGQPLVVACPYDPNSHRGLSKKIVVYAIVGVGVGASLIALGVLWLKRKKTQEVIVKHSPQSDQASRKSNFSNVSSNDKSSRKSLEGIRKQGTSPTDEPKIELFTQELSSESIDEKGNLQFIDSENGRFELEDLLKGSAEILGRGLLGSTYKATLAEGLEVVVVKRLSLINNCKFTSILIACK